MSSSLATAQPNGRTKHVLATVTTPRCVAANTHRLSKSTTAVLFYGCRQVVVMGGEVSVLVRDLAGSSSILITARPTDLVRECVYFHGLYT